MTTAKPDNIDAYIAQFPKETQKILQQIRATIKIAAPEAEEKINYGIPTFTLGGRYLVYFAAYKTISVCIRCLVEIKILKRILRPIIPREKEPFNFHPTNQFP